MYENDVLQPIADADIPKLRDIYEKLHPRAVYIYNYLSSVIRWKSQQRTANWITLLAPNGNWKDGTFIALHEYSCYELVMFTLEEDCKALYESLVNTKRINWNRSLIFYSLYSELYPTVLKALEKTTFRTYQATFCGVLWLPKEKAAKLEVNCPSEVYVDKLNPSHAAIINSHWPHRYHDSDKYIATIIEMNGGYGVFLKSNGTLVSWVLRNMLGLGALQTVDEHKRKGYGSLATKALAKELAEDGLDPLGTVLHTNAASQGMFRGLGFEALESVVFIENEELRMASYSDDYK